MLNSVRHSIKSLRLINFKIPVNDVKVYNLQKLPSINNKVSNGSQILFSPRSFNLEIRDVNITTKIKQDPLVYTPIINPHVILPVIEKYRKDEITLPSTETEEKLAARLLVIRRKKMKKHKRKKLWKKMRHRWARVWKNRRNEKEKAFQNELLAMIKQANEFSAENYVKDKIARVNHTPIPAALIRRRLPLFIIRQILGLDKKINYKHTEFYKA